MIKINLLPTRKISRQNTVVTQLVIGGVILVAVSMVCLGAHLVQKSVENGLLEQKAKLETEIAESERLIGEVKEFEKKKAELDRKLGVIKNLRNNKLGPVKLLEELSVTIPKKVWVVSIRETTTPPASHSVALTGEAISDEVIAEFMSKLEESDYFSNVNLIEARAAGEKKGVPIQSFQITTEMSIPLAKAEPTPALPQN